MVSFTKISLAATALLTGASAIPTGLESVTLFAVYNLGCLTADGTYSANFQYAQCPKIFTFAASGTGVTISSSKGACGIVSGKVACGATITPSVFNYDNTSGQLYLDPGFSSNSVKNEGDIQTLWHDKSHLFEVDVYWGNSA